MTDKFKPLTRGGRLIAQATDRVAKERLEGNFAPDELVRRMTHEGQLVGPSTGTQSETPRAREPAAFSFVLAAAVEKEATNESVLRKLGAQAGDGLNVTVFEIPRRIVLMEFDRMALSPEEALRSAVQEILKAHPEADFIDLSDPDAVAKLMVDVATGNAPSVRDLQRILRCHAPTPGEMLLAVDGVDGLLESMLPHGPQPRGTLRYVEAEVFEIMPALRLVHLQTLDGRMFGMLASTPGLGDFDGVREGQRYVMLVGPKFNLVLHAELQR